MGLFVSLYLILLAFFIVLEVQSEMVIARSEDALDSVQQTFKPSRDLGVAIPSVADAGDTAVRNDQYLSAVSDLFRDELALEGRYADTSGGLLVFTMPTNSLFSDGSVDLRAERASLVAKIGALTAETLSGERREISIFFSRGQGAPSGSDRLLSNRMSELRALLLAEGMDAVQFIGGFEPADAGTITVIFRRLPGTSATSDLKPWGADE